MSSISPGSRTRTLAACLVAAALAACGSAVARPGAPALQARPAPNGGADVLSREQIDRINAYNMEQLLTRRFNGLEVRRSADGDPMLSVRGEAEPPLIVLDGSPGLSVHSLWQLDPSDIQEIRLLREGGTSIYGLDGGRGVLVITTRKY